MTVVAGGWPACSLHHAPFITKDARAISDGCPARGGPTRRALMAGDGGHGGKDGKGQGGPGLHPFRMGLVLHGVWVYRR
ncbi:hypothetical protein C3920_09680 [Novacetimonas pomaceti]|uniref:Uncharacterized protein n=1 Tax=Novacetimonas pomaceti TaxID=2021998 RepID=A0ABX5P220_9PROT|nr:hypothetical protein C3920_09680 [Novacetimonas pomaceti]